MSEVILEPTYYAQRKLDDEKGLNPHLVPSRGKAKTNGSVKALKPFVKAWTAMIVAMIVANSHEKVVRLFSKVESLEAQMHAVGHCESGSRHSPEAYGGVLATPLD